MTCTPWEKNLNQCNALKHNINPWTNWQWTFFNDNNETFWSTSHWCRQGRRPFRIPTSQNMSATEHACLRRFDLRRCRPPQCAQEAPEVHRSERRCNVRSTAPPMRSTAKSTNLCCTPRKRPQRGGNLAKRQQAQQTRSFNQNIAGAAKIYHTSPKLHVEKVWSFTQS